MLHLHGLVLWEQWGVLRGQGNVRTHGVEALADALSQLEDRSAGRDRDRADRSRPSHALSDQQRDRLLAVEIASLEHESEFP